MTYSYSTLSTGIEPSELHPIDRGVVVKLGFVDEAPSGPRLGTEWMFVHVVDSFNDGTLGGILLNLPLCIEALAQDDYVSGFTAEHVYQLDVDPDIWRVSRKLLSQPERPER